MAVTTMTDDNDDDGDYYITTVPHIIADYIL